jgi:hypothetical protein
MKVKIEHIMQELKEKDAILICQMGKVGSSTVADSLKALELNVPILHFHHLTYKTLELLEKKRINAKRPVSKHLSISRAVLAAIEKGYDVKKWKIISLTREPIARSISVFFHHINKRFPDFNVNLYSSSEKIEFLVTKFLKSSLHNLPLTWFDQNIKQAFNIDVFSDNFDKKIKYKIYKGNHPDLLVLRLENINECAEPAIKDFLGIDNFSIIKSNIGSEKKYSRIYQNFLDSVKLPESYIEKMYSSKYAKYFYSQEELEEFKTKWSKQDKVV